MKEKDGTNVEDALARLQNTRSLESVLESVYTKLNCASLSDVQKTRLLKCIVQHLTKDGSCTDLRVSALSKGLEVIRGDLTVSATAASGATFNFLEACCKIMKEFFENANSHNLHVVSKAMESLSLMNATTASKIFSDGGACIFKNIISACLKMENLNLYALMLLDTCTSASASDAVAKAIAEERPELFQLIYPLLFNARDGKIQNLALKVISRLNLDMKSQPFLSKLKADTQNIYCKMMTDMVIHKSSPWPAVWQFVVKLFGDELHSGGLLINVMLEVLERAFKHSDFDWTRVQAFECWKTLIDNFKSGLSNKKRIDLIMIPLRANNHRIEALALAKLETYSHLLKAMGKELSSYPEIFSAFLLFCCGPDKISCHPVRSYPALQVKCVKSIGDVLMSPHLEAIFVKVHKDLILSIQECFCMENISIGLIKPVWDRLLELISKCEGSEVVKVLLQSIQTLVAQAGAEGLKMRHNLSAPSQSFQLNTDLGKKIVVVALNSLVNGKSALASSYLGSRSLYLGSSDVMNGTLLLLVLEWLLTPALMLAAGDTVEFNTLISRLIEWRRKEPCGFMDFSLTLLKKLPVFDDSLSPSSQSSLYQYATNFWCTLANEMVEHRQNQGELHQGNTAHPEFVGLYSVLMFPVQFLHVHFNLIEKCSPSWKNLFYEACIEAELIVGSSAKQVCEQVCIRLIGFCKPSRKPKQFASVYRFLTCILKASEELKSSKTPQWIPEHVSFTMKELNDQLLNDLLADPELLFKQVVVCTEQCLKTKMVSEVVFTNISSTICTLLAAGINTFDCVDQLCSLLRDLKKAYLFVTQHSPLQGPVDSMLDEVVKAARAHVSQKIRTKISELFSTPDTDAASEKQSKSPQREAKSPNSIFLQSPKSLPKKFPAIQMSPSHLSPGGNKRKLQAAVCGSDGKYVRIDTPPKKIILTEHQKEVRRERRQDIPALYQDLSQDTQSISQDASQDCVALPSTPKRPGVPIVINEDAVMDVDSTVQVLCVKKIVSPRSLKMPPSPCDIKKETKNFTPPAGFLLSSGSNCKAESEEAEMSEPHDGHPGKENDVRVSPSTKLDKSLHGGAVTRSNSNLMTRSGKKRSSLAASEFIIKKRSARKSLPIDPSHVSSKPDAVETVVIDSDNTDTESMSSIASDASSTAAKTRMLGRPKRTSTIKRGFPEVGDMSKEPQCSADTASSPDKVEIISSSKNSCTDFEVLKTDDHTKSTLNRSLPKVVGGKVFTRSRSNSSLDEVVGSGKKRKDPSSTKLQSKAPNVSIEINPSLESLQDISKLRFSRSNSDEGSSGSAEERKKQNSGSCFVSKRAVSSSEKSDAPSVIPKQLNSEPSKSGGAESKGKVEEGSQKSKNSLPLPILDAVCTDNFSDPITSNNGVEESQDIIESSQEHFNGLSIKQCSVSLKQFRVNDLADTTEIEDVIVEKGPNECSPYKVHAKDSAKITTVNQGSSMFCRPLNLQNSEILDSSSVKSVSEPEVSSTVAACNKGKERTSVANSSEISIETQINNAGNSESARVPNMTLENASGGEGQADGPLQSKNDCLPEWMHEKKSSPASKALRMIRIPRSQAFMKHVPDADISCSPPKSMDMSPVSSPVQAKKVPKTGDSSGNATPLTSRFSRATQLLGLGQAAAVRGGHTVVANVVRSVRSDKTGESTEEDNANSSSVVVPSSTNTNGSGNATITAAVSSPSVRRHGRISEHDVSKSTPQKCLEDKGLREDWIPRAPSTNATPDSSILKRRREVDSESSLSPSVKKKRVSFRDPPLSCLLKFGETTETHQGTVFSSDRSSSGSSSELTALNCHDRNEENASDMQQAATCASSPQKSSDGVVLPVQKIPTSPLKKSGSGTTNEQCEESNVGLVKHSSKVPSPKKTSNGIGRPELWKNSLEHEGRKMSSEEKNASKATLEVETTPRQTNNKKPLKQDNNKKRSKQDKICSVSESGSLSITQQLMEGSSEHSKSETQGMLDDLFKLPSKDAPVYVSLVSCSHPVNCIVSELTTSVWKKSLMRELSENEIHTVGDLANLTEDRLDRLTVKPPKRTNVLCVLEDFEKNHCKLKDDVNCGLNKESVSSPETELLTQESSTPSDKHQTSLKNALADSSLEDIMKTLSELGKDKDLYQTLTKHIQPQDVAEVISSHHQILECLDVDLLAEIYFSQASKSTGKKEKNMTSEELYSLLSRVPVTVIKSILFPPQPSLLTVDLLDMLRENVLKGCSSFDILTHVSESKLPQLLKHIIQKHLPSELDQCHESKEVGHPVPPVFEKCSPSELIKCLSSKEMHSLLKLILDKLSSSEIVNCMDSKMLCQLVKPVLQECSPSDIVKSLDTCKADPLFNSLCDNLNHEEVASKVLPKLSAPLIAENLSKDKVKTAAIIEATIPKIGLKDSLKIISKVLPSLVNLVD